MANKMLIDAAHPEETRVVVLRGSRVEEFDFESASKKQLRGNIYLAKVIRVEPSLQAAFVDYGGNRHGFLAFSEIHPDYYQIPFSDRQALLEEESQEEHEEEEERRPRRSRRRRSERPARRQAGDESVSGHAEPDESSEASHEGHAGEGHDPHDEHGDDEHGGDEHGGDEHAVRPMQLDAEQTPPYDDPTADLIEHASELHGQDKDAGASAEAAAPPPAAQKHETTSEPPAVAGASEPAPSTDHEPPEHVGPEHAGPEHVGPEDVGHDTTHEAVASDASVESGPEASDDHHGAPEARRRSSSPDHDDGDDHDEEDEHVDQLGGDAMEEVPRRAYRPRRQYKIQEVIKRRQVLLVQVVKEERGNKGAAITTYLSLAGRYSVLMPNTARGGGISRKITDAGDRQRLKSIAQDLEVPDGMGVILRTAGAMRTKPEVKRDFEYLMRMWETVREMTLASSAPTLVYEEGSLIKRSIRDLYNKDVEEILVAGENGYREAKEFMRLLMPSHAKNVQLWRDPAPLFTKGGAEAQLDAMFSNQVTLKSGGSLVINQTEALVAIDVNSGRSTREHNIEDTALRTNLEASDEVARQLRLRDLAGLIVVDFIDMEESRNNRAVERRLKDALKDDRARIQIGRISHFGLLEMSRQRIRTGVLEGSTEVCQHCAGAGMVRSTASIALHVLRLLEDALIADASRNLTVRTRGTIALYILNHKRDHLSDLEGRFGVALAFENDEHLTGTTYCALERGEPASGIIKPRRDIPLLEEPQTEEISDEEETSEVAEATPVEGEDDGGEAKRRRRRRRGRGRDRESSGIADDAPQPSDDALSFANDAEGGFAPATREPNDDGESTAAEGDPNGESNEEGRSRRRRSRRGGRRTRDARSRPEAGQDSEISQGSDGDEHVAGTEPPMDEGHEPEMSGTAMAEPTAPPVAAEPMHAAPTPHSDVTESPTPAPETLHAPPIAAAPTSSADLGESPDASDEEVEDESRSSRRPEPVSSDIDPSRPKKSGWWQRAKATLGN